MKITGNKRIVTFLIAFTLVFVMLFSIVFVLTHEDHDCKGADCQVCHIIHLSKEIIKLIAVTFIALSIKNLLFKQLLALNYSQSFNKFCPSSLFALKIRMNN